MQQLDNESTTNPFADMERQHQEFLRRIEHVEVTDILGVVDAMGAGGSIGKTEDDCTLVFHFAGWRQEGEALQTTELRVEMPVSEKDLSLHMARIKPYDIPRVKGQVADHPLGRKQALVQEIISYDIRDDDLEAMAEKLQKPVIVDDSRFGTFTLNRSVKWFCGDSLWAGTRIKLNLSMDGADSVEEPLAVAAQLWDSEEEWNIKIVDFAVKSLLPVKNEAWLDEGEAELDADQFKKRVTLESITVYSDGAFEFWYDDGDMFLGHVIMVVGSLVGGLDRADICG